MISPRLIRIAKNRVIKEIRECCQRTIESRLAPGPPIRVVEYQIDVLTGNLPDAGIFKKEPFVIEREAGRKGIRKSQEGGDSKSGG